MKVSLLLWSIGKSDPSYPDGLFASVVCVRVLPYHFKADIIKCLREFWRVLQTHGKLYLDLLDCADAEYGCGQELEEHTFLDPGDVPIHFSSRQEVSELLSDFAIENAVRQELTPGPNVRVAWRIWAERLDE